MEEMDSPKKMIVRAIVHIFIAKNMIDKEKMGKDIWKKKSQCSS